MASICGMEASAIIRENGVVEATGVVASLPWWSLTKTVLATALMRLSEMGRCNLDEAVADEPYTPAQLLRHEAGLPDYGALQSYHSDVEAGRLPWPIDDLLFAVEVDRLRYKPGYGWAYSNIGYWRVGRLIEEASDRPLADALADLVFKPAGLVTARLAVVPADLADVCMGDAVGYHPGWVYHGLVVGSVTEAARLLHELLFGSLVEQGTLARMLQCRPLPQFRSELYPDPAYGLGLMLGGANRLNDPIGHSGGGPGSRIAAYAQRKIAYVVWAATTSNLNPEVEVIRSLQNGSLPPS